MMHEPTNQIQIDLDTWDEFEGHVRNVEPIRPLFRGQASSDWELQTTLERSGFEVTRLIDYFKLLSAAKPQIETFTDQRWADLEFAELNKKCSDYEPLSMMGFPAYELCVYARHHGFPSPLLDWTHSPYIAAFFAFQNPLGNRVAIWKYQASIKGVRVGSSDEPKIRTPGHYVTSHRRHFLQQGEYTVAMRYDDEWLLAGHQEVISLGRAQQDVATKYTLPSSEKERVLQLLDRYNINAYSLLQSEESLMETVAFRLLARRKSE